MPYEMYENRANPHITIHKAGCRHLRKHGGEHKYGQGEYHKHETLEKAHSYAQTRNLPIILCSSCNPSSK